MDLKKVEKLALEAVESVGVRLYYMSWTRGGRQGLLRLFIDKEGGVTVADCERVSRELGTLLDVEDPIPYAYSLEVSSPGLDRQLYTPDHYRASIGKEVEVRLLKVDDLGTRRLQGLIRSADDEGFTLEVGEETRTIPYDKVTTARWVVKF